MGKNNKKNMGKETETNLNTTEEKKNMEKNNIAIQAETVVETNIATIEMVVEAESNIAAHAKEAAKLTKEEKQLQEEIAKVMKAKGLVSCPASLACIEATTKKESVLQVVAKRIVALCACHVPGASYTVKTSDLAPLTMFRKVKDAKGNISSRRNSIEEEVAKAVQTIMAGTQGKVDRYTGKVEAPANPVNYNLQSPSDRNGNRLMIHFTDN